MYALTVRQPWAALIAHGGKTVENRGWPTTYRGPLLIHASTARLPAAEQEEFAAWWKTTYRRRMPQLARRSVVAVADLVGVCTQRVGEVDLLPDDPFPSTCCGVWADPGSYHWQLDHVRALPVPIPEPGRQRLWTPHPGTVEEVHRQLPTFDLYPRSVAGEVDR